MAKPNYRIAESLDVFREQFNEAFEHRSKDSDGWIGNAEHASRSSDHNPWVKDSHGQYVVTAFDLTHDPLHGVDCNEVAKALINSRDKRIKYIIWNKQICSGADGPAPWQWRKYTGKNSHTHHLHLSVEDRESLFDYDKPWAMPDVDPAKAATPPAVRLRVLKKGDVGDDVKELQKRLNAKQYRLKEDGAFGDATDRAVRDFQRSHGLEADGVVGAYTREKLDG